MILNLMNTESLGILAVFSAGALSFFSPCVLPILPIYMTYLAGHGADTEDGKLAYNRKKVFFHTLFFVLGISISFFILGFAFTEFGKFFSGNRLLFAKIGGMIIALMGLFQLGIVDLSFLNAERRIKTNVFSRKLSPLSAMLLGFTFSFAWTPCIGPTLSSVLILAASAKTEVTAFMLITVYALGFFIPFLLLGLFTSSVLKFLEKNQKILAYLVKVCGVLLVVIGILMFTGNMNSFTGYLNKAVYNANKTDTQENKEEDTQSKGQTETQSESSDEKSEDAVPAYDFSSVDQYGNEHSLEMYKGKVIVLNFWATWCGPCKKEIPDISKLYEEYGNNENDVIILGVSNPTDENNSSANDIPVDELKTFLKENNVNYPTLMDSSGEIYSSYAIQAFPTTFVIDKNSNISGYAQGALSYEILKSAIEDALK